MIFITFYLIAALHKTKACDATEHRSKNIEHESTQLNPTQCTYAHRAAGFDRRTVWDRGDLTTAGVRDARGTYSFYKIRNCFASVYVASVDLSLPPMV
jgi:hypothetical protein